jgi:hypothetical protein
MRRKPLFYFCAPIDKTTELSHNLIMSTTYTQIEDSKEPRKSVLNRNIHVWDGETEYIVAFLGSTSARLMPVAGGSKITVSLASIAEYLDAPAEGKCDCCGRVTRHIIADRETGLRVFRHEPCDRSNWGAL